MRSTTNYIVEHQNLDIDWYAASRGALVKRGPKVVKGIVHLGGLPYAVNSKFYRHEVHRRFRRLPWPLQEEVYAFFAHGIPDQMPGFRDFPQVKKMEEIMSSTLDTFSAAAESNLSRKFLRGTVDLVMLLLALGAGVGIGGIIFSLIPKGK